MKENEIDRAWMHSIRKGSEVCIAICKIECQNINKLIERFEPQIERCQTGIFLASNGKTRTATAVFITKDPRLGAGKYQRACEQVFPKEHVKGKIEFKEIEKSIVGIAELNTGFVGLVSKQGRFNELVEESFKSIKDMIIENLERKGYTKGKIK